MDAHNIADNSVNCCPSDEYIFDVLRLGAMESNMDSKSQEIMLSSINKLANPEPFIAEFNGFCTCQFKEHFDGFCPEVCRDTERVSDYET